MQRAATSKEMQYTELQCASHITSYIEIFTQIGLGLGNMRHCQQWTKKLRFSFDDKMSHRPHTEKDRSASEIAEKKPQVGTFTNLEK